MLHIDVTQTWHVQVPKMKGSGGYEKKFLHLAVIKVLRGETEDTAQASHGSVVINLADFSSMQQGPKKLAFRVSVTREITTALEIIGKSETPTLIITLSCEPPLPTHRPHQHSSPMRRACQSRTFWGTVSCSWLSSPTNSLDEPGFVDLNSGNVQQRQVPNCIKCE
jgi:hypothetical protein